MKLRAAIRRLEAAGVEDAAFDALQLVCAATGLSSARVMTEEFDGADVEGYLSRRESGEPLQYILGQWEFMGLPLKITPDCLIPRADTEVLASFAVDALPQGGRFADLCTGSGCIALAVLSYRPDACGVAVELYEKTLAVAKENAASCGVSDRLEFILGDVRSDVLTGKFDVIVSNPPYVTLDEMNELSREVAHEPPHALTDGGDGLSVIRRIIEIYPSRLKTGGTLAIEIGWRQGEAVKTIAAENGLQCLLLQDTAGRDRVAVLKQD